MDEMMYGGRMGNTSPGDATKYKGRGFTQLTGKDNYKKYGDKLGIDLINNPELAEDPKIAAQIATEFWKDSGAGAAARKGDLVGARKRINGGTNGLGDTLAKTQQYLKNPVEELSLKKLLQQLQPPTQRPSQPNQQPPQAKKQPSPNRPPPTKKHPAPVLLRLR